MPNSISQQLSLIRPSGPIPLLLVWDNLMDFVKEANEYANATYYEPNQEYWDAWLKLERRLAEVTKYPPTGDVNA